MDYIKKRIDQIKELSAMSGAKPAAFLNSGNFDTSKQTSSNQQTVYDNTIFYAVAFDLAFDDKGTPSYSGKLDKVEFKKGDSSEYDLYAEYVRHVSECHAIIIQ